MLGRMQGRCLVQRIRVAEKNSIGYYQPLSDQLGDYDFMRIPALLHASLLSCLLSSGYAQDAPDETPVGDFNFVYSAILGTGFYSVGGERVLILQLPYSEHPSPLMMRHLSTLA